jgi:hypothetical protein
MATAASRPAINLSHISEVLEMASSILQRHRDDHLAKKTLLMQGFLEMSQHYPERNYNATINMALARLVDAVHLHLNAELHIVSTLFARLGTAAAGRTGSGMASNNLVEVTLRRLILVGSR